MKNLVSYLKESLSISSSFSEWEMPMELLDKSISVSESLQYHLDEKIPIGMSALRYRSETFLELVKETKQLLESRKISVNTNDAEILSDIYTDYNLCESYGEYSLGIIYEDNTINEAEYKGKEVELDKPKRGSGDKKFYVYVKNDKGNIIKVKFGVTPPSELANKFNDPKRRKAFADRHNCDGKKDKTKPGYWACRVPKYAKLLGMEGGGNFWW